MVIIIKENKLDKQSFSAMQRQRSCHPERSEGSSTAGGKILRRCAPQDDKVGCAPQNDTSVALTGQYSFR